MNSHPTDNGPAHENVWDKHLPDVKPFTVDELRKRIQGAIEHIDNGLPTHAENDIHRLSRDLRIRGRE